MTAPPPLGSLLRTWAHRGIDLQTRSDVAVVIPTLLRPTLPQALTSIFGQDFAGRIQILVGIDAPTGRLEMLDAVSQTAPSHCIVQALYPGYSTSMRHGGMCEAFDGGALRSILSYLANAPLIAYLDDDNWWDPRHLATLASTIDPVDWAFSKRCFMHPDTGRRVCVDLWESVGPGAGIFEEAFNGFVDPSCLMLRRDTCAAAIPWWTKPLEGDSGGGSADRHVFDFLLRNHRGAGTGEVTTFYRMNPKDGLHPLRLQIMGSAYDEAGAAAPSV